MLAPGLGRVNNAEITPLSVVEGGAVGESFKAGSRGSSGTMKGLTLWPIASLPIATRHGESSRSGDVLSPTRIGSLPSLKPIKRIEPDSAPFGTSTGPPLVLW